MNFYDVLILGVVSLFVINGYRKGFIISLATFAALIAGIYIAVHFSNYIQGILKETFSSLLNLAARTFIYRDFPHSHHPCFSCCKTDG